jgi:hypothetical protein
MESLHRIEQLIQQIDAAADPNIRAVTRELIQTLMDFHGAAIERMLEVIAASGESGTSTIGSIGRDDLAGAMLLLYNLHPDDIETRVRRAVNKMRNIELESVIEGVVRLRVAGNGAHADKAAIETAIYSAAPEAAAVVVEGLREAGFVPLEQLMSAAR